jgi:hypothetical protein
MKRIIEVDAKGREDLLAEIRRYNDRMREIEDQAARRSGRAPTGPVVRAIALPVSNAQADSIRTEGRAAEDTYPPL